ncbi:MAG TPA: crosslink repair DNA glycosylase YcaQ family protein [Pyrinomonadaceae bacterium]|nr:crosslink repair DNA glycosylase YcaQ family protein [Pyrinomonadaceae bacterium]
MPLNQPLTKQTTLDELRRFTVARNFFKPTTLKRALDRMGFVQADPIRAPARAQDLILRHRVRNYQAGDLERRYATLDIEEDFFVNYGFVTTSLRSLMHPREKAGREKGKRGKLKGEISKTELLLAFVRERGAVHPREVDEHFSHGAVKNNWGGTSNATTRLLEAMHYRGLLRVARREKGIRLYTAHRDEVPMKAGRDAYTPIDASERRAQIDALVDAVVRIYAPLPGPSLSFYVRRLRYAAPRWQAKLTSALQRAKERLSHASVEGTEWYWPAEIQGSGLIGSETPDTVRLLAPFDPLVHDRARFQLLWGWEYRFEAYTPAAKRKLGYYALPLLWRDRVIGWGNLSIKDGELKTEFGYVESQPRERAFKRELEAEQDRLRNFLAVDSQNESQVGN